MWQVTAVQAAPNVLATLAAGAVFAASMVAGGGEAEQPRDPGGDLTAAHVRACLERWPEDAGGLVFRTTRHSSDSFVGVLMMDPAASPAHTATVGIAVYDDADLLDAYEERARQDQDDDVARVQNAVVAFHGPFTGRLALGERRVRRCLR